MLYAASMQEAGFRLSFVLGFVLSLAVFGGAPAFGHSKKSPSAKRCLDLVEKVSKGSGSTKKSKIPRAGDSQLIPRDWIRENLLLGYERTYTNPILEGLLPTDFHTYPYIKNPIVREWTNFSRQKNSQELLIQDLSSLKTNFDDPVVTHEQIIEVSNFLKKVLGAKYVKLSLGEHYNKHFKSKMGFKPHVQPISMEVVTKWGTTFFVTLEPGCIEVNQPPTTLSSLESVWSPIEKSANKHNYFAVSQTGESSGGGTHLHVGWKSIDENLWAHRPDILANFIELPIIRPELFYLLHTHVDNGPGSSARSIFEGSKLQAFHFYEFLSALRSMALARYSSYEVQKFLQTRIEKDIKDHNQYMSLKNIGEENPRVEIRMHDSFSGIDELKAVAVFWSEVIYQSQKTKISYSNLVQWRDRIKIFQEMSPLKMRDSLESYLKKLELTDDQRATLMNINDLRRVDRLWSSYFDVAEGSGIQVHRMSDTVPNYGNPRVELEWSKNSYPKAAVADYVYSDAIESFAYSKGKFKSIFDNPIYYNQVIPVLVYSDSTRSRLIDSFAIETRFKNAPRSEGEKFSQTILFGAKLPDFEVEEVAQFVDVFFKDGFLSLGGEVIGENQTVHFPKGKKITKIRKKQRQALIDKTLESLPFLKLLYRARDVTGTRFTKMPLRLIFEIKSNADTSYTSLYLNGKKTNLEFHSDAHNVFLRVENVSSYFEEIVSKDGHTPFHLSLQRQIGSNVYYDDYIVIYDFVREDVVVTPMSEISSIVNWDSVKGAFTLTKAKPYNDQDRPDAFNEFLKVEFR